MKLLLVFNPGSAHGRAGRRLEVIGRALAEAGFEVTVLSTREPGDAETRVAGTDLAGFDVVAAAGGDGTLFETLNGLMAHPPGKRPPLGVIPLGTGNAFARELGLSPGDWRGGIEILAHGRTRRVDVGRIHAPSGTFHFLNIAGIGFVSEAGRVSGRLKFAGRMAYTLGTLWCALRRRAHAIEIVVDGQEIRQDSLFLEVSNSRFTGTSFLIAPGARIDDGRLDVILVRRLSCLRLLRLFPTIYSGRHVEFEEVTAIGGHAIEIRAPAGLEFMVDGEFRGTTPARIECLPGEIEMIAA